MNTRATLLSCLAAAAIGALAFAGCAAPPADDVNGGASDELAAGNVRSALDLDGSQTTVTFDVVAADDSAGQAFASAVVSASVE